MVPGVVTGETEDLEQQLAAGYTLPGAWYAHPAVYQLELQRIFRHAWQYVGLREDLAEPGDFLACTLGCVPVIVLRDPDGELRGFVNVCRHRGSQVVLEERGNRKLLQCHYHAWTYNLDGSLRAAPGEKDEPNFDRSDFSLTPIQVQTWGPFVFVNPDLSAPSLAEYLGELPGLVRSTGLRLDALRCRERRMYDTAANWKVVVENYLECYHCPVAHPAFSDLIDVHDYHVREYDTFSVQGAPIKESAKAGRTAAYTIGEGVGEGMYVFLWPNFMLNIYPGRGNVSLNLILPTGVERSTALYHFCFVDEVGQRESDEFIAFVDQVQQEDIVLCESVQRGLSSGFFERGRLMLTREHAIQHFQRLVYNNLAGR